MDSVPLVDHDDQGWFASRQRAHLNQKATLRWEDEAKSIALYLSWRDLSWICNDPVSTIHIVRKVLFYPTFRSFFTNLGGKPPYIVEVFKSSTLVIRATSHFAKIDDTNCGMWARTSVLLIESILKSERRCQ